MKHLFYLNKFFWKYRILLAIGTVFIIIANLFALYPAEFVRKAFDAVILSMNTGNTSNTSEILIKYGSLIVLFAILKGIFMYCMRQTIIVISRKIEYDLKNEIYQQYQALSISFYKKNKTGDLMNRISEDVSRVRMYLGPALMYAINIFVLFLLVISKMLSISTTLTIYVLLPLPILAVSVYFVSSTMNKRSEKVQAQLSDITTVAQETFSGIKIIKSFSNEDNALEVFMNSCKSYTKRQLELVKIEALFFPLIISMIGVSSVLTVYIGGLESFNGNISTGNIAEFIIYVNMLAWPVASIGWITSLVQRSAASQERINDFLLLTSDIENNTSEHTPVEGDIVFNEVNLSYTDTNIQALKNISFTLKEGNTLGIFGKTGSGKSTIANLVCRLYDTSSGSISFEKTNIKNLNLNSLRTAIGYIPQDGYLFSGTIRENIAFSSDNIDNQKILEAAKKADILDEINNFKEGLDTIIGERGVQLSGGQRQRLAIARTFYKNPSLYIFDDCLSAIDATKEQRILKQLKVESKAKSSIIISHRISTLKDADKIIVLDNGEITESGSHIELLSQKGFYFEMHQIQTNKES
ncbi:MAG: putative multidrug resistance ABC transporter ATP-binding/permease protein YheI [Cryomorphaceae bacterium]|nr:MAG: putative multidrug resistance ABC transporter ATP-binding/permease protein YheI [Cryomorphaceae bacterium]